MVKNTDAFDNKKIKVPFVVPTINSDDKNQILKALSSNLLTDGPNLREFEKKFQNYTKSNFSTGVSNATAGLMLSLKALDISENDEIIIPDMTFVATANAVLSCNATPVLADVTYEDLNISIDSIEENITNKTRAIIPVHFAGKSCNMKQIMKIAKKYDLKIVEDCAHALGTFYNKKHVGTFGDTGCFSFYPTKNLTTFEGGMITSKAKKITDRLRRSRNHGINKSLKDRFTRGQPWEFDIEELAAPVVVEGIFHALELVTFYTVGEDECRAWTICRGQTAIHAAARIHSDLAERFIRAEVTGFKAFQEFRDLKQVRLAGKMRLEGRDYLVQDGDLIEIRHN